MKNFQNMIEKYGRKTKRLYKYCQSKNISTLTKIEKEKPEDYMGIVDR